RIEDEPDERGEAWHHLCIAPARGRRWSPRAHTPCTQRGRGSSQRGIPIRRRCSCRARNSLSPRRRRSARRSAERCSWRAASPAETVTSATATAAMLSERAGAGAFVIGERGLREALTSAGIELLDGDPEHADLVVVGLDRQLTYAKLKRAVLLVRRGADLVA